MNDDTKFSDDEREIDEILPGIIGMVEPIWPSGGNAVGAVASRPPESIKAAARESLLRLVRLARRR